jgi:hypothetical protein
MPKVTKAYRKKLGVDMLGKATKLYIHGVISVTDYEKIRQIAKKVEKREF